MAVQRDNRKYNCQAIQTIPRVIKPSDWGAFMRSIHGKLFYISAACISPEYVEPIKMAPPAEIAVGVILYGLDDPFVSDNALGICSRR